MAAGTSCKTGMYPSVTGAAEKGMVLASGRVPGVPSSHQADVCWAPGGQGGPLGSEQEVYGVGPG